MLTRENEVRAFKVVNMVEIEQSHWTLEEGRHTTSNDDHSHFFEHEELERFDAHREGLLVTFWILKCKSEPG